MRKITSTLAAAGLAAALALGGAANAEAANGNLALSLTGGRTTYSANTAFQVNNNVGKVVADANRAQASSLLCNGCKTVAVSVQIDLAAGPVLAIRALNQAIATTNRAVNADTCASAYQFIVAPDAMVVFSATGKAAIDAIKAAVVAEVRSANSCAVIVANVAAQMDALTVVLSSDSTYEPGTPGATVLPHLNVNRYQDNKALVS